MATRDDVANQVCRLLQQSAVGPLSAASLEFSECKRPWLNVGQAVVRGLIYSSALQVPVYALPPSPKPKLLPPMCKVERVSVPGHPTLTCIVKHDTVPTTIKRSKAKADGKLQSYIQEFGFLEAWAPRLNAGASFISS